MSGGAVGECAASIGDDTIDLTGRSGTMDLTSCLPDLASRPTLTGPGEGDLTIRRNTGGGYRIFTVDVDAMVAITGLTISNGYVVNQPGAGI